MSFNERCQPSPECMTKCPAVLRAVQRQAELEQKQERLAGEVAAWNEDDLTWNLKFNAATVDEMRQGDMWRRSDMHETFMHISEDRIEDEQRSIKAEQDRLDLETADRISNCTEGPGKRYRWWGGAVCRSELETQNPVPDAIYEQ